MSSVDDIGYGRQFGGFYDRIFPSGDYTEPTVRKLASLHPQPGERALELGVGTGRVAIPLAQRAFPVRGVDSSPEMLDQLRTKAKEADADVEAVHGDIRKYSDDAQYGLVYCVCATLSMILDADDQRATIQHAADRLAPGGVLVVETSNPGGLTGAARRTAAHLLLHPLSGAQHRAADVLHRLRGPESVARLAHLVRGRQVVRRLRTGAAHHAGRGGRVRGFGRSAGRESAGRTGRRRPGPRTPPCSSAPTPASEVTAMSTLEAKASSSTLHVEGPRRTSGRRTRVGAAAGPGRPPCGTSHGATGGSWSPASSSG